MTNAKPAPDNPAIFDAADVFSDLDKLRLPQNFAEDVGVRKLTTTVPIRRPPAQSFIRVHGDPSFRENLRLLILKDDGEVFVIARELQEELASETVPCTVYTAISREGTLFLWAVRLPGPDGKMNSWWQSAAEAAELAMSKWVRIKASKALGAYEIFTADGVLTEPNWPADMPFSSLLRVAFKDRVIDRLDHPVIQRLRGLA